VAAEVQTAVVVVAHTAAAPAAAAHRRSPWKRAATVAEPVVEAAEVAAKPAGPVEEVAARPAGRMAAARRRAAAAMERVRVPVAVAMPREVRMAAAARVAPPFPPGVVQLPLPVSRAPRNRGSPFSKAALPGRIEGKSN